MEAKESAKLQLAHQACHLSVHRPNKSGLNRCPMALHPRATAACLTPQCQPGNTVPKEIPTALTADPSQSGLNAALRQIIGGLDNYRRTWT